MGVNGRCFEDKSNSLDRLNGTVFVSLLFGVKTLYRRYRSEYIFDRSL